MRTSLRTRSAVLAVLAATPAVAQRIYQFHESGGPQPMRLSESEVAVKARPRVAESALMAAVGKHAAGASVIEKWDPYYLVFTPPPASVKSLTAATAPLLKEAEVAEAAPVLYVLIETPRLKSQRGVGEDVSKTRIAGLRIATRSVLASLPDGSQGSRLRQATGALSAAAAGYESWWIFEYATPYEALDAAAFLSETEKLAATPVFARIKSPKAGPKALTPNDVLYANQWHLNNATHGINVTGVWDTFQGAGRYVTVIDGGIEVGHPDLAPNAPSIASGNHFDFVSGDNDPSPPQGDSHGTAAAGLAAARGNNGLGVTGVAFLANLLAVRLLGGPTTDANERDAFTWRPALTDVSSNSWGSPDGAFLFGPGPLAVAGLVAAVTTGRGGRGVAFFFPAGNGRNSSTPGGGGTYNDDSNFDGYANSRYVIAVAAVTDGGQHAFYSENGANVAISAPSSGGAARLTTTDVTGANGYSATDYTSTFGGTSGATPIAAGAGALLLQANPNLGWRDVREILIRSASRTGLTGGDPFATNGGGIPFSHSFGGGRVNVGAAVALANGWSNLPPETSISATQNSINTPLPDANLNGAVRSFNMTGLTNLRVETVELTVNVTHPWRGDLRFTITSPSGMQSVVGNRFADSGDNYNNWTFTSIRHLGETSSGTWTVRVADVEPLDTGTLNSLTLRIWGTPASGSAAPPQIVSPANGSTLTSSVASFQWTPAPPTDQSYDFRLFNHTTGALVLKLSLIGGLTSQAYTLSSGVYRLEMRTCNPFCGTASTSIFTVTLPAVPTGVPAGLACTNTNNSGQNRVNCNWGAVARADFYFINIIQAGAGPGGGALTVAGTQVGATTVSLPVPNGVLDVIVRACNGDGCGAYSPPFRVIASFGNPTVPILAEPFGGSVVDAGTGVPIGVFTWSRAAADTGGNFVYRLYVQDFSRNAPAVDIITSNNFHAAHLNPATRYDALVIAIPVAGGTQLTGPAQGFITRGRIPTAPSFVAPTVFSSVLAGIVTLGWTPIPFLNGDTDGRVYQYSLTGPAQRSGVIAGLNADVTLPIGTYSGAVRACTTGLNCTAGSEAGWGPWSGAPGGEGGPTTFTLR
ncbi:MAG: hypothetical protein FJW39_15510 [Acidobacteria bacterium]|nr:hypothetical protein [Acidobacteriota bacterium]